MATIVPQPIVNVLSFLGLNGLLTTNFQALNVALGERIVGQRVEVKGYSATGATTTRMTIGVVNPPGSTPWAVTLVLARESKNPAADLSVSTRVNFSREGQTLFVFEPAGLVANTQYDLGFLVIFDG
jgi:hypothetical protein